MKLKIQNNFITNLPADPDLENSPQVKKACYSYVCPTKPSNPSLIHANGDMATKLGTFR
jgi:hypothetical protein